MFFSNHCVLAFTGVGPVEYKTQYIEDIVSCAFLHVIFVLIIVHRRSLALARLNIKTQYIDDVVSCAFLHVTFVSHHCALAFSGVG